MATDTDVTDQAPETGATRSRPRALRRPALGFWGVEALWLLAVMAISLVVVVVVLKLWDASPHIPLVPDGDGMLNLIGLKGMIDHGWFLSNGSIGAPVGEHIYDFAGFDGDGVPLLMLRIMAFGTSDPAVLMNAYFVLGFPLVAGAGYAVLRGLGINRPAALVGGIVYTALPYHFFRSEGHLYLGNYFMVPGAAWLVLRTFLGDPLLVRRPEGGRFKRWLTPVTIGTALAVVAVGGATLYYVVFTVLLVGSASLVRAVAARGVRPALPGLAICVALGVLLIIDISPALIYQHEHGSNPSAATRQAFESEVYAGSLIQTVLPIPGHRIDAFAKLQDRFQATTTTHGEVGMQIGLLLSISLFCLLIILLARAVSGRPPLTPRARLAGAAGAGLLVAFLFDTFGGLGSLMATLISPQIRAWNRLSPFIAFFALVGLALALDAVMGKLRARAGGRSRGHVLPVLVALLVGVVALYDQTSSFYVPDYKNIAASWRSDGRFVTTLEHNLPKNAMVLQLPLHPFPEAPAEGQMVDYDLFRGYIHSTDLRWSYGAMKGRPEDWTTPARSKPLPEVIKGAVAAGFVGIYVDHRGYDDNGEAVEAQIRKTLGVPAAALVSEDGRLAYFDASKLAATERAKLSPAQRAQLGDSIVRPVATAYSGGLGQAEGDDKQSWNWVGASGTIAIDNSGHPARAMELKTTAASSPGSTLRITVPGRPVKVVRFPRGKTKVDLHFTAPSGKSKVALTVDGPDLGGTDPRDLRAQLFSLSVSEDIKLPTVKVAG
jgi:phosphoglycerol transferase